MNWFGAKSRMNEVIGVEFSAERISFAHIKRLPTQQPLLVHAESIEVEEGINCADILRSRLSKLGIQKLPCNLVLSSGNYQMLLGEAPKVPQEELAEALRWRIKDLVQFPIAEAVLDAFLLPEDSARGTNRMAYAVVAQRSTILQLLDQAKSAHLNLHTIDIPEFAMRNLAQSCCDTKRGVALVRIGHKGGSLQIIRDGNLYLTRQFSLPYNAGRLDDLPTDELILELQRSLDYFERQMRQSPPSHIYLCGENVTAEKLTPEIRNGLTVKIELFNAQNGLQFDKEIKEHIVSLGLFALGAALRETAVGAI